MAKFARFLSEFPDDWAEVVMDERRDSSSRSGSSSAEIDDVGVVLSEAVSVVTVVLSLLASSVPMIVERIK